MHEQRVCDARARLMMIWGQWLTTGACVAVPLAPRLLFPAVDDSVCIAVFSDASREWGLGGWTMLSVAGEEKPIIVVIASPWPADLRRWAELPSGGASTAALELAGLGAVAYTAMLYYRSHGREPNAVVCLTDSEAAMGAVNSGSSSVPDMAELLLPLLWPRQLLESGNFFLEVGTGEVLPCFPPLYGVAALAREAQRPRRAGAVAARSEPAPPPRPALHVVAAGGVAVVT